MSADPPVSPTPPSTGEPVPQPAPYLLEVLDTQVLLVRHGESAAYVPGDPASADPPLSELGVAQAAALGRAYAHRHLDAVVSSDLARAASTAAALAGPHGLEVTLRQDLREVDLGEWNGGGFRARAAARDPEFLEFARSGRWSVIPGAETDEALQERVHSAVTGVAASHRGGTVAVVCHSGVINALLAHVVGADRSVIAVCQNTSVSTLRTDGERWLVVGVNDVHHLDDIGA